MSPLNLKLPGAGLPPDVKQEVAFRVGRWGFFAVLISLLPIAFAALRAVTREDEPFSLRSLLETGELLIVTAAVLGAALSELVALGDRSMRLGRFLVGCVAGTVAITCAAWYADISSARRDGASLDHDAITSGSVTLFCLALIVSLSCIITAVVSETTR